MGLNSTRNKINELFLKAIFTVVASSLHELSLSNLCQPSFCYTENNIFVTGKTSSNGLLQIYLPQRVLHNLNTPEGFERGNFRIQYILSSGGKEIHSQLSFEIKTLVSLYTEISESILIPITNKEIKSMNDENLRNEGNLSRIEHVNEPAYLVG